MTLPGSTAPFASRARALGPVRQSQKLSVQFWLRPREDAAAAYATEVSTPGSALFGHYLSPAAYTARFAAPAGQARAVMSWLRGAGYTGVAADSGRDFVQASAPVPVIERSLRTRLRYYQPTAGVNAGGSRLRANSSPVSVPASVGGSVLAVTGLDNVQPRSTMTPLGTPPATPPGTPPTASPGTPAAAAAPCSRYYGQHYSGQLPRAFGTRRFPTAICGYTAAQVRQAYGLAGKDTGAGTTVAIVETGLAPGMPGTLRRYARASGLPAPSAGQYRELSLGPKDGRNCGTPSSLEEQMDVEATYAMAPAARQLLVAANSCDHRDAGMQTMFDAETRILNGNGQRPLASIVSNSWEGPGESQPARRTEVEHAFLVRAAAEGVGMYFSSGDSSGVNTPSSDPYAIAVGGTTLGIGPKNTRLFETGWSTDESRSADGSWVTQGESGAASGGPSLLWAQPGYQRGVVPASLSRAPGNRAGAVRAVPDISALADSYTGFAVEVLTPASGKHPASYATLPLGGTSLATPLVAGIVADAQAGQSRPFGFLNPALYRLAGTPALYDPLPVTRSTPVPYRGAACTALCDGVTLGQFDDQSSAMPGYTGQVTARGYDTMTGTGVPQGGRFIQALRAEG